MTRFVPLAVGLAIFAFIAWRLADPSDRPDITSQLVGEPAPSLSLEPMIEGKPGISAGAEGEPYLINIFGSWCNPCIAEAPLLEQLAERGIPIRGIAVRDTPEQVERFLADHGDPFVAVGADPDSQAMFALGATGVPETYLVGPDGIIRAHIQGPLDPASGARLAAQWEALR